MARHKNAFNADPSAFIPDHMSHDRSTQMSDEHWLKVVHLLQDWVKKPTTPAQKLFKRDNRAFAKNIINKFTLWYSQPPDGTKVPRWSIYIEQIPRGHRKALWLSPTPRSLTLFTPFTWQDTRRPTPCTRSCKGIITTLPTSSVRHTASSVVFVSVIIPKLHRLKAQRSPSTQQSIVTAFKLT